MRKSGKAISLLLALTIGIASMGVSGNEAYAAKDQVIAETVQEDGPVIPADGKEHPIYLYGSAKQKVMAISAEEDVYDIYSEEYMGSEYYEKLVEARQATEGLPFMERVLEIGQSQDGYMNYAVLGDDPEELSAKGVLWTGVEKRNTAGGTGNTEYTRWAQRYLMHRPLSSQYLDSDWCAIFASWCLFQAGYYSGEELKTFYYSYYADPRRERGEGTWITAFNFDQNRVWYTPLANKKLDAYSDWCTFVNTDISPYDIPYKPGGMIFFSWDNSGTYFHHVAIVIDYDKEKHILRYLNGNSSGMVRPSTLYFDRAFKSDENGNMLFSGAGVIMAYAEYACHDVEVKGSWHKNSKGWWYSDTSGWNPIDQWMCLDGNWYHFNADGYLETNCYYGGYWLDEKGVRHEADEFGWEEEDGKLRYKNTDGTYLTSGMTTIDGEVYYFKADGTAARNEWYGGYFYQEDGKLKSYDKGSWHKNSKGWRFSDPTGWYAHDEVLLIDGVEYHFNEDGYIIDNQEDPTDDPTTETTDEPTAEPTEEPTEEPTDEPVDEVTWTWKHGKKGWWYESSEGEYLCNGWNLIDGRYYYFHKDGYMAQNEWVHGYWLGKTGAWIYHYTGKWHKGKKGWWFGDGSGWYAADETVKINRVRYTFDEAGYLVE